jgi:hypothetical protein
MNPELRWLGLVEPFRFTYTPRDGRSGVRGWDGVDADTPDPGIIRVSRLLGSNRATSSVNSIIN